MSAPKPTLAVISTFDDLCGIAGYTKPIVGLLAEHFDITVFDLDQFLFKSKSRRVQRLADRELNAFCRTLGRFDAVNLQLEHGTLGNDPHTIMRRLRRIVTSCRNITITFHTIFVDTAAPGLTFARDCLKGKFRTGYVAYTKAKHDNLLASGLYGFLRRQQSRRRVTVIVHTRRDARLLKTLYNLKNVHDHPLASLSVADARQVLAAASRDRFPALAALPPGSIVLGCFGFLSRYKGFDTALQAMQLLPEHFHLAIFGATHPNSIVEQATVDPYVKRLMGLVNAGKSLIDIPKRGRTSLVLKSEDLSTLAEQPHRGNIARRVHFMGALSDADFPVAMAACDTVVLPYLEVGQSSSGPLNWAIMLGKHIIASRTKTFIQSLRYYPGRFRTFDIGNFIELAETVAVESAVTDLHVPRFPFPERYSTETNIETYLAALLPDGTAARASGREPPASSDAPRPAERAAVAATAGG
jgi:glycosyltransferase involved in cell wall biosynthesis